MDLKFQSANVEIDWEAVLRTVRAIAPKCSGCGVPLYHKHCEGCRINEIGEALIHDTPK